MKMLLIVVRDSMLSELEALLRENGIRAYTIISDVKGTGLTGRVDGAFLKPDINSIIFSVLPSDHADRQSARSRRFTQPKGNRFPSRCLRSLVRNTCRTMSFLA
jgi:hypothetical protein